MHAYRHGMVCTAARACTDEQHSCVCAWASASAWGKQVGSCCLPLPFCAAEMEYEASLLKYLRDQGKPVKLATLGSAVKRPTAVPKMKPFLATRPKAFKIDDTEGTVSLA
jgi:hypothetical protein